MPNPATPAALAVFEAINSGDLSRLEEYVTPTFVDHGSPFPIAPGPDGYREILSFVTSVLKIRYTIEDLIETDARIALRATARGEGVPSMHGAAAEGKSYMMTTMHIYRTEGDRLAEHWGVRDEVGAMVQMGVLPLPSPI